MRAKNEKHSESGFSLLEMLIVIIIFTIAMGMIFTLLNDSLKISNTSNQLTEAQQSLRTGQEYMTRDLYNTADNLVGLKPSISEDFVTDYLAGAGADSVANYVTNIDSKMPVNQFVLTGMIMTDAEPAGPVSITYPSEAGLTVKPGTDRVTILTTPDPDNAFPDINTLLTAGITNNQTDQIYVSPAQAAGVQLNEIYLLVNPKELDTEHGSAFVEVTSKSGGTITFGSGGLYDLNKSGLMQAIVDDGDGIPNAIDRTTPLYLRRVWLVHYFVDSKDRLIRRVFGQRNSATGAGFSEFVIAENAAGLRFDYIRGDEFSTTLIRELDTQELLNEVRQVRVGFTTETARPVLGANNQPISNYTLISPRNLQFRRAL